MSDSLLRRPSKFISAKIENDSDEVGRKMSTEIFGNNSGKISYQIKGTHDKSYLDLSQLKLVSKISFSSDSDITNLKTVKYSRSQLFDTAGIALEYDRVLDNYLSADTLRTAEDAEVRPRPKILPSFLRCKKKEPISRGSYGVRPIASADEILRERTPANIDEVSFLLGKMSSEEAKVPGSSPPRRNKYFIKVGNLRRDSKRRGYYSEVVSPYLRPQKILEERMKEEEKMMREHQAEDEGKGEEGMSEVGERDDSEKIKAPPKEWPPIYEVLNPEPALAELDLPIAYKELSLINKGRMPEYTIHLTELPQTDIKDFLQPEEKWVVYETEPNIAFPVQAFMPKCYILHVVEPGTLPRKVFVERRRREYASESVEELLEKHGLTDDDLLPPTTSKVEDQFGLFGNSSFLPLEVFDDNEFDPCSVTDWLNLGKIDSVQYPVPAVAFVPIPTKKLEKMKPGKASARYTNPRQRNFTLMSIEKKLENPDVPVQYVWIDVAVTAYNPDTREWSVVTLDGSQTKISLPRIYIMFRAEDPQNFALRVLDAVRRRHQTEKLIKFRIYCDSMPLEGMPDIECNIMERIHRSVTRNGFVKGVEEILHALENDIQIHYKRVMVEMSFVDIVNKCPDMFSFITLPDAPILEGSARSVGDTGMENFHEVKHHLNRWWLYVLDETYLGMVHVVTACLHLQTMNFFNPSFGKHVTLEEFESIQSGCTNNAIKYLRKQWVDLITTNVRMCLQDIGKGWFNMKEKSWRIYELSKLCRYMELIKFRMQTALKCLVENSTDLFVKMVETPCVACLNLPEVDYTWGDDLIHTPFRSTGIPLFSLVLKLTKTEVSYSTSPDAFEGVLLRLYDNCIALSHTIQQVHPNLLVNLRFPDLYLSSIGLSDPLITKRRERLRGDIRKAVIPLKAYADEYQQYLPLFSLNINEFIVKFAASNHSAQEIRDEVLRYLNDRNSLEIALPTSIAIGPFYVYVEPVKKALLEKLDLIVERILYHFAERMRNQVNELNGEFYDLLGKMLDKPSSIENIFEIREWLETVPGSVKIHEETISRLISDYEILDFFSVNLENEDFENKYMLIGWPHKIENEIENALEMLTEETDKFLKLHQADEMAFWSRYEWCIEKIQGLMLVSDIQKVHEIAVEVRKIWKTLKENQELGHLLNSRQKLFGIPVTSFEVVLKTIRDFTPYKDLWITSSDWLKYHEIWMENPLSSVDGENMDRLHGDMYKTMGKCQKIFADVPANFQIATEIRNDIDSFRPYISIIQALKNPGMKDRHWNEISRILGGSFRYTPTLSFRDFINAGIFDVADRVISIAEVASKEYAIEQALDKMNRDWEAVDIELSPYKETGTYIMKLSDEVLQMLDDHIVSTQQLSFSPFKGIFEERIDEWEAKLQLVSNVLTQWAECQRQWLYLEPIFTSEDISEQLPVEVKKFSTMERTWRRIMKSCSETPKIMQYCPDKRLYESLKECNFLLEQVQKGLSEYLESKRMIFPRLYFLSDDELLEILSQTRNPLAVQPHLRKCFENVYKLYFESDLKITKMYSGEGECVDLKETMYPKGGVESWLLQVEEIMKKTVRLILSEALEHILQVSRNKWVLVWPGQVVIAGSQTFWTASVEEGLREKRLDQYFFLMLSQLDGLRELLKGPLKKVERQILSALIVIEVHARDITEKMLREKVENVNDFEWISQLRYYWVNGTDLKVRAVNAEFQYGYEYLGNSGRLVITPLTDRCYLTLTGALHLKFGGAPAGPAGTGKTETTKDLAKAMAIQCVVFNCSDQLDFMAMGKFFKGLASSGAWACFDEFNRIDIEVLSVVAQQVITIQKAQIQRLDRFMFEGVEIALKASCAIFITMNPGYAGRTELPDNLKALFRPVAMMVPNYTLIAEISLFSFGFSDAKELAGKITTTFKLSSEQLSSQDHYDFGMRAVKTVIAVAGNLKRERPRMDERQIVLRALRDVNVPKFLGDDLKLFNGIISDLFPRMVEEPVDYGELEESIRATTLKMVLEDVDGYVKKVIQLYDTTVVRHGLMLIGPAGSGKTKCYEILKDALTNLRGKISPAGSPYEAVHTHILNPKSVTMGQLYGEFDLLTHEWTDGIFPSLLRVGAASENLDKHWYVFDGPVDAVWIENMNTVLDDNKKLCLTSGEIIKLTESQTMMFEVADLAVASPATVSRCGMVYLEPAILGLQPFINCWFRKVPNPLAPLVPELKKLFDIYVVPGVELLRTGLKEIVDSIDSALVFSFLKQMDARIRPLTNPDGKPLPGKNFLAAMPDLLAPWVIYSLIWSIGGTCDNASRVVFSHWLREKVAENGHKPDFPPSGLVYDYRLHDGGFSDPIDEADPIPPSWIHWMADVEEYNITINMKFSDIEIPTIDYVRNSWHLGILLNSYNNILCVGPTGTGKTLTVNAKLSRGLHKKFISDLIGFSARTSANQTQDLIDSKLDKRRRNVYGPPVTKRQVFFIDDLNMPALEVYGAQPPIELLRQWMDFGGWYDRKEIGVFRHIIDTNFVAAMGPPGGGRNPVTTRLMRHFHYVAFTEMEDDSKMTIFGTIVGFWMRRTPLPDLTADFVRATIKVYSRILRDLLPTPNKTHYTFNLRDLSKVFQGVLMMEPEKIESLESLLNLWYHENCRVFQDRLVNEADRLWFDDLLRRFLSEDFEMDPEKVIDEDLILYADFCSDSRNYERIRDHDKLLRTLEEVMENYNSRSTAPMKLVLFSDALEHTCRISRILRQPQGNALLLGMGGSGRQSLSRLASHACELYLFHIELSKNYGLTEWRDDVKSIMLRSGIEGRESTFLFSDTQIKFESFLEDLNSILNSGDVPNIYSTEEMDKIFGAMRGPVQEAGLQPTKSNLFATYCKSVRSNLHCILTMSPIGEIFRARLRQFPAFVNCCTIDWFFPWPDSALQSVAQRFLQDVPDLYDQYYLLDNIVSVCQFMHQSVIQTSKDFLIELNRHNYVTPTLYLELLSSYSNLVRKKKLEFVNAIERLQTGLNVMQITAEEVKVLEAELYVLKPNLEKAAKEAAEMISKIAADTLVAEETKAQVAKDEATATEVKEKAQALSDEAQKDLELALPALEAAEKSLQALNKGDIGEVKALKTPPTGVITVIETICIIKGIPPKKIPGPAFGTKINDYWEPGKKMMADAGQFLTSLLNFDKESLTEETILKLEKYVTDPDFQPSKIIKVSKACTSLCMWVHAMYKFYFINKIVMPKKAALKEANETLAAVQKVLDITKAKMAEILKGLSALQANLRETEEKKAVLEASAKLCEDRMDRAFRLINGLADEKERWIETVEKLRGGLLNIIGDILISSGAIAYLTPFTDAFRRRLFEKWTGKLEKLEIPHSPKSNPVNILGDPIIIRQWQIYGLPRDYLSTENGVLVAHSRRWPLFIDPQGQANKWVRNLGKEHGMSVVKLSDKDLLRTLEASVRFGKPCLIENVGTELDPALDPVLLRQVFKQAGTFVLKLGDTIIPYNDDFRLYLTTKLPNPHYTPEVSIKVLLVNFTLVPSGLQDQLLALVVMQERPDLEEARSMIVVSSSQMKQELAEIEDRILYKLTTSKGSPVDDVDLIQTLEASKIKSEEIKQKVQASEITQADIDNTRSLYIPVANRAQILFFCLMSMSTVDPMYQYSMDWFINIFVNSMANTEKTGEISTRTTIINDYFTFSLYANVCRSLFEKHKLLFSFLLCIRIMLDKSVIDPVEYQFLLTGGIAKKKYTNPAPGWISERSWTEITSLDNLQSFVELVETFRDSLVEFKRIFDALEPHREPLPSPWDDKISSFQNLLLLKCLRPDKLTNAMQDFVASNLGVQFIEPVTADLQAMYKESTPYSPLIFVLSTGTDPAAELYKFADRMKMAKRFETISLGQGQGPIAEKMLSAALDSGSWVYFQNCHLAPSWMPRLERLIENISSEVHKEFRLWLTSTPSPHFPVAILQNGSKMTVEPPRGIKANMIRSYLNQVTEFTDFFHSDAEKVPVFKWLLFSLCLFHGVCLERRKFGPLGFNIPYEFTDGDLRICISQLHMFLLEYSEIPFKVLTYTSGQINYGGRVTDDWDRRCIMNLLSDYYHIKVCNEKYAFDENGFYHQLPQDSKLSDYLAYLKTLPLNDDPSLFGLHPNADISCAQAETFRMLSTLLSLQPTAAGAEASSQEDVTSSTARSILDQIPNPLNTEMVQKKYPVLYEESLNTVLVQEVIRYNKLLTVIQTSLNDLLKALKGLVVMSAKLEEMAFSMFNQKVPLMWSSKAYPSLKPLGAWVADLKERVKFMEDWIENGIPASFWISGFYFPQAFFTGTLQNYARKYIVSIDTISFTFKILKEKPTAKPADGCCIYGLFLEGARFDGTAGFLAESKPKELYTDMPYIWLVPKEDYIPPKSGIYECPVYKTLTRAGTLSTTGHSTNYVLAIEVPSNKPQSHWISRGVALFCALDY